MESTPHDRLSYERFVWSSLLLGVWAVLWLQGSIALVILGNAFLIISNTVGRDARERSIKPGLKQWLQVCAILLVIGLLVWWAKQFETPESRDQVLAVATSPMAVIPVWASVQYLKYRHWKRGTGVSVKTEPPLD